MLMRDLISQTKVATTVHCRAFAMARQYCAQRRRLAHVSRNKDRSSKRMDARKRVRRNHGSGGVAASTGGKGEAWICDVAGMRILVATGQSRVIVIVIAIVFVLRFVLQEQIRGHRIIEGLVTKAGDIT